ncbi:hypothetical protein QWY15_12170 [Planococcus sp. N064]|uniref:Uncharacterized protein n=1 Tax=Planococcus liqunii TaxID=3058394 RepID=A0ABT8MT69_9BACL|nr:hypothetical protein [Planococcus sp. N064]MDN7228054.1 hypothetical protein [Planococcus sp. N064]
MSRLGISFVLLFFFLMPSQSANAEKEQMPSGSVFSQLVVGSIVTTFINSEEGKMLVTFDRRTGTFTSLTADFLSENEEQEQFRILKAVRVNEVAATKPTKRCV